MNSIVQHIIRAILLMLLQVLLLNHVHITGLVVPFVYVLFIMMMPYHMSKIWLLLLAFAYGGLIDIFSNTIGIHAASLVFLAYIRPFIIRAISVRDYSELSEEPNIYINGFQWFLVYTLVCVFAHHLFLYFAEAFTTAHFFSTILRVVSGTLYSSFIIMLVLYLTSVKKKK